MSKVRALFFSEQYDQLLSYVSGAQAGTKEFATLVYYKARALVAKGLFDSAAKIVSEGLARLSPGNPMAPLLTMIQCIIKLFSNHSLSFKECERILQNVVGQYKDNLEVNAAFHYFKSLNISFAISVGAVPETYRKKAVQELLAAAKIFRSAGNANESAFVERSAAAILLSKNVFDYRRGQKIIKALLHSGILTEPFYASVQLLKAEADFRFHHSGDRVPAFEKIESEYQDLAKKYARVHPRGSAGVYFSFGQLLVEYNYEIGLTKLHTAIELYASQDEVKNRQSAWNVIADWHFKHGNMPAYSMATAEAAALQGRLEFNMTIDSQLVHQITNHHLQGNYAEVIRLSEAYLPRHGHALLAPQVRSLYADALKALNELDAAITQCEEIIAHYSAADPGMFYAEALMRYAITAVTRHPQDALLKIDLAIQVAEKLKATVDLSRYYVYMSQLLNNANRISFSGTTTVYTQQYCCIRAIEVVTSHREFIALRQLGYAWQNRAVYSLQKDGMAAADPHFQQAEQILKSLSCLPELAFFFAQKGIAFYSVGQNTKDSGFFKLAYQQFQESVQTFQNLGLNANSWPILRLQALAVAQIAILISNESERHDLLQLAEDIFREAAFMIDALRGYSSIGERGARLLMQTNFGLDKQALYQNAFAINMHYRRETANALWWLEKMKNQSLIEMTNEQPSASSDDAYSSLKQLTALKANAQSESELIELQKKIVAVATQFNAGFEQNLYWRIASEEVTWEELKLLLRQHLGNALVIEYYYTDFTMYVFGLRGEWEQPRMQQVRFSANECKRDIDRIFGYDRIKADWIVNMEQWQVYNWLIADIQGWCQENETIYIIPFGILHNLPLHTLTVCGQYLIERNEVVYCQSLSLLNHLLRKAGDSRKISFEKPAIFGNSTGDLPGAEKEALWIGELINVHPFLESAVKREIFIQRFETADFLHFSGHGEFVAENGLEQHLVMADNEKFRCADVLTMKSNLCLLVLSGCETGVVRNIFHGDENIGMLYGAFCSGVMCVISSLWRIDDEKTYHYFLVFYKLLLEEQKSVATAFRETALHFIQSDREDVAQWAAFIMNGISFTPCSKIFKKIF